MTKARPTDVNEVPEQADRQDNKMSEQGDKEKKVLSLSSRGKLELKSAAGANVVKQSFSHGRSKNVAVEVKRKRTGEKEDSPAPTGSGSPARATVGQGGTLSMGGVRAAAGSALKQLTAEEREVRERALRLAALESEQRAALAALAKTETHGIEIPSGASAPEPAAPAGPLTPEQLRQREIDELKRIQEFERGEAEAAERKRKDDEKKRADAGGDMRSRAGGGANAGAGRGAAATTTAAEAPRSGRAVGARGLTGFTSSREEEDDGRKKNARGGRTPPAPSPRRDNDRRSHGKLRVADASVSSDDDQPRGRSMASIRRAHERDRRRAQATQEAPKISREVVVPETITVQELANRMAERGADVIKTLMKMGVMATITQTIDADTAELVAGELGHRIKRVAESDIELGLEGTTDQDQVLSTRPPVVTIMGHVDHGKTSLLDAMRRTNVVAGEAGGITQHIGAYQVSVQDGRKITFIDTPGHAAFTEMRARGANVTDIVILVVAADDGIMPQTVEAIRHAKAANVPMIVAINKCDLPAAKPDRVRQELLQHDIQVEEMGGDVLSVEISAKTKTNLDKLLDAILLQSDVLDLKANPDRPAQAHVIEARVDRGRGSVATVLIQKGTLRVGDIFVAGHEWGKVRALLDDRGNPINLATPAMPAEVLGLTGTPDAGDDFVVVDNEARAREVTEFRQRRHRSTQAAALAKATGGVENMFTRLAAGNARELPLIIKGDVHGSVEAIKGALEKLTLGNDEVRVRVLDATVGAISEADINLAKASRALVIAFNVRPNPQAREMAKRDAIEIRYYSIIYNIIDDVKASLGGMLAPTRQEKFLGYAEILQIFNITKVGKVAGCRVTEGIVKRGSGVRLLRDNVVIHQGTLKTLRRIKDEVKEVREGYECGMAFENYDNIAVGDRIECFEVEEIARTL